MKSAKRFAVWGVGIVLMGAVTARVWIALSNASTAGETGFTPLEIVASVVVIPVVVLAAILRGWGARRSASLRKMRAQFPGAVVLAATIIETDDGLLRSAADTASSFRTPKEVVAVLESTKFSFWRQGLGTLLAAYSAPSIRYSVGIDTSFATDSPQVIAHLERPGGTVDVPMYPLLETSKWWPRPMKPAALQVLIYELNDGNTAHT